MFLIKSRQSGNTLDGLFFKFIENGWFKTQIIWRKLKRYEQKYYLSFWYSISVCFWAIFRLHHGKNIWGTFKIHTSYKNFSWKLLFQKFSQFFELWVWFAVWNFLSLSLSLFCSILWICDVTYCEPKFSIYFLKYFFFLGNILVQKKS